MLAFGGLLIAVALLALALAAVAFRRPDPHPWTTSSWAGELTAIAIVSVLALGIGYLGAGAIRASQEGIDLLDLGLLGGVFIAAYALWRTLGLRQRLRALAADPQTADGRLPGGQDLRLAGAPPAATGARSSTPADRAA